MPDDNGNPTLEELSATVESLNGTVAQLNADNAALAGRLTTATATIASMEQDAVVLRNENASMRSRIVELGQRLEDSVVLAAQRKAELDQVNPARDAAEELVSRQRAALVAFAKASDDLSKILQAEASAAFADQQALKWTDLDRARVAQRQKAAMLAVTQLSFAMSGLKTV